MKLVLLTAAAILMFGGVVQAASPGAGKPATKSAAAPAPLAAPAVAPLLFDFKGIALGISLPEFRATPFPDQNRKLPVTVMCTGDKDAGYEVSIYGEGEKAAGVVKCVFWGKAYESQYASNGAVGLNMGGGQYATYDYSFKFAPDGDGVLHLYSIVAPTNVLAYSDVTDALTAKYGKPTSVKTDTVQSKAGATFPHTVMEWDNPAASITAEARWSKIDDMGLILLDKARALEVQRKIDAQKASVPNRI